MTDDFTQAEIVRSLQRIEDGMTRMRDEWQATLAEMVRRDAWEQKNTALDRELKEVKEQHTRDVAELKEQFARPPVWPSVVSGVVAAAALAISLIT